MPREIIKLHSSDTSDYYDIPEGDIQARQNAIKFRHDICSYYNERCGVCQDYLSQEIIRRAHYPDSYYIHYSVTDDSFNDFNNFRKSNPNCYIFTCEYWTGDPYVVAMTNDGTSYVMNALSIKITCDKCDHHTI